MHARALQTHRHVPHSFASVVGVRAGLSRVLHVAGWLVVVAIRAGKGRRAAMMTK
jgi:hypothetical protein